MISAINTFGHSATVLGGRAPQKPGTRPHLAELVPEIAISRHHIIRQIKDEIRQGKSMVISGQPGVGKSALFKELFHELSLSLQNIFSSCEESRFIGEIISPAGNRSGPVLIDDLNAMLCNNVYQTRISERLNEGAQYVFASPLVFLDNYIPIAERSELLFRIIPPADLAEFSSAFRFPTPDPAKLFTLCGGNYRLAEGITGISDDSITTALGYIFENFSDSATFLVNKFSSPGLPVEFFWRGLSEREKKQTLFFLKTGLLALNSDQIGFRGQLIEEYFKSMA